MVSALDVTQMASMPARLSAGGATVSPTNAVLQTQDSNMISTKIFFSLLAISTVPIGLALANRSIKSGILTYRALWVGAFVINLITVSLPGRFDGQVATDGKVPNIPWATVFAPAPWAFAIWAVIYLGELFLSLYVGLVGQPAHVLKKTVAFWAAGNIFQSLWCFVFRPTFISNLWLPMIHLGLGAVSLLGAHNELTKAILPGPAMGSWEKAGLILMRSPISLHAGWLCAATLLNLNGWAAVSKLALGTQVAVGFASAYIAAAAGAYISVTRGDPLIALTVAWALAALSSQTRTQSQVKDLPASTAEALSVTEKFLSNLLVGTAVVAPTISKIF